MSKNENIEPIYSALLADKNPAFPDLIDKFIACIPGYLAEMDKALLNADSAGLKQLLHKLKGLSGNYGYPLLYEQCKKAEQQSQQQSDELEATIATIVNISKRIMLAT